jgi:hypothetical protein
MKPKVFLISLLAVALVAVLCSVLYMRLGPHKRIPQENRQVNDDSAARQASVSKTEAETAQPQEGLESETEIMASNSQPSEVINKSGAESRPIEEKKRDSEVYVEEDTELKDISESVPEAFQQSPGKEKRARATSDETSFKENATMIRRSAITPAVEDREPKGVCEQVSVRDGRVYCWVHVINGKGREIIMRWIANADELWETRLSIGSNNWRTWAYITLRPGMIGPAQVDILDEEGQLLHTESFRITG